MSRNTRLVGNRTSSGAIDVGDQVKMMLDANEKKREGYVYTEDPTCQGCSPFDDQFKGEMCRVAAKPHEGSGESAGSRAAKRNKKWALRRSLCKFVPT